MQTAIESARTASESLKAQVSELKHKIEEGERTATTLVARKNAATAQQKVSEALAGVGKADNAFATLSTFEKSVAKQEATAKAFGELASAGKDDTLEAEFAQLGSHSVDAELEALKRERRLPPVEFQKELPPAPGH
jgi:phage shock protein A